MTENTDFNNSQPRDINGVPWVEPPDDMSDAPAASTMSVRPPFANARAFLSRIRDWNSEPFTGLHYTKKNPKGGKPFWNGVPVKSVDAAVKELARISAKPDTLDIYVALGTQRETETKLTKTGKTFQVALRSKENTVSFKTLFVDLDVKAGAYTKTEEAASAMGDFIRKMGLPPINMVVASGTGGLHCYWVLDREIPAAEWHELGLALAEAGIEFGLKFDAQCSYDYARILRVPDTFNCKRETPLPVRLGINRDYDTKVEDITTALQPWIGKARRQREAKLSSEANALTSGLAQLRNIDEVAKHCPWVDNSLKTGGVDNDNALRHLIYKISTACHDPEDTAWRMVGNRKTLAEDEFVEQFDRAQDEVEVNPKLAWPSCETVAAAGAKPCQTCQYKGAGCKPLTVPPVLAAMPSADLLLSNDALPDIAGGVYEPDEALREISARFAMVDRDGEVVIIHRTRRGKDNTLSKGSFERWLGNTYIRVTSDDGNTVRNVPAAPWWLHNIDRPPIRLAVFKTHEPAASDEYNFWRGFGVPQELGTAKMRRLLHHMRIVICKRNKKKLKYLLRWLAWCVQNPDRNPETAVVLKGEGEGSGKTTVSQVMLRIFGPHHGMKINTPTQLFGPHVDYLEFMSFLMIEEALFAGDPRIADQVKDFITGSTVHINPKGRKAYSVANIVRAILTTNHDWAVPAGKNARRWFVCEVDEERTFDRAYFNALYGDLEDGGYGQFLNFLLNVKLGKWHPRNLVRTEELQEQQMLSASHIKQWLMDCAEQDGVQLWGSSGMKLDLRKLGAEHATSDLFEAYCGWRRAGGGGRVESKIAFGKTLTKVLGNEARVHNVLAGGKRSPGYFVPTADELLTKVRASIIGVSSEEDV
jgi:hypothetical protein